METLASAMKNDRRWRSHSKPYSSSSSSSSSQSSRAPLIMAFLSCLAWLYIAGRLWQDAQSRTVLSDLLRKNSAHRPKVLTVEDKLMHLGCKEIGRKIVEAEMDLTLAKSQGYLRMQNASSEKKLLAVVGVYTGFGSRLRRNTFRGSWMPRGNALKKLEERGVIIRFVIGRSANRGDSLDRNIDEENRQTKDFLVLESHEEAAEELPKKAKFFFSAAVERWDAEFYVKVDDGVNLDLDGLIEILESHRDRNGVYIGCMKSGVVVSEEGKQWYEPEWWKFGDGKTTVMPLLVRPYKARLYKPIRYFRHASSSLFILSKDLARYININSASLQSFAHDDISVGSWMMGLDTAHVDDDRLCCSSSRQEKVCSIA